MSRGTPTGRSARGLFLLCIVLGATPLAAQVRPPARDTLRADTARAAQDTVLPPAVVFPQMPISGSANAADAVWIWDHAALLRETPLTLVDLLERIPGVAAFRAGMFVQPEAAAAFGGTVSRMEIELDGYPLDPLSSSSTDLSRLPLGQLREVRVERRLDVLRIRLLTEQPTIGQPASRVEAGIGQPPANLFRGIFLAPHVIIGPLGAGVERLDTDGFQRRQPASVFNGWVKWGWTSERRGLQLEVIRTTLRREPDSPWQIDRVRQDMVLRGRNVFAPRLVGEAYLGRVSLREKPWQPPADNVDVIALERNVVHAGARLAYNSPIGTITGAVRYRDLAALPRTEAQLDARFAFGAVAVGGALSSMNWKSGENTAGYELHARAGVPNAALFAELTGGRRGAPNYLQENEPVLTERTGWRVGAALSLFGRATGSVALVNLEQDLARPFGLPFDSAAVPSATEPARGIEAFGRVVLWPGWFALEGSTTYWSQFTGWTYLPARTGRGALELHTVPLPSGNLEILGRLEAVYRGGMLAYGNEPTDPALVVVPRYFLVNGYLQIRIIDVRIFLRYEDLLGNDVEDLPGRFHRGPRLMYGVKWNLWN